MQTPSVWYRTDLRERPTADEPRSSITERRRPREWSPESGFTLPEILTTVAIVATLTAAALPIFAAARDRGRGIAAARYLAGRLRATRSEALNRSANVAMQFSSQRGHVGYAVYRDGNGNGVRSADIHKRTDPQVLPWEGLTEQFPGVDFGFIGTIPAPPPDAGTFNTSDDPIRVGSSRMVSFSALGAGTPGTVYLATAGGDQLAVRILGASGRIRVMHYDQAARTWRTR